MSPKNKICTKCGIEILNDWNFCGSCGNRFEMTSSEEPKKDENKSIEAFSMKEVESENMRDQDNQLDRVSWFQFVKKEWKYLSKLTVFLIFSISFLWMLIYRTGNVEPEESSYERPLIRVISEDYPGIDDKISLACSNLEYAEELVDVSGDISPIGFNDYIESLEEARTAFLLLSVENPKFPKYKNYLDYTETLIEWAKDRRSINRWTYDDLYYGACF